MKFLDMCKQNTCCFSGYRPYKFKFNFEKGNRDFICLENNILNALLESYNDGYRYFLCGGAMGFDILCGEIVLTLKKHFSDLHLICVLPFKEQAKSYPLAWAERYNALLEKCDFIDYISREYFRGSYYARNEKMVDMSSRIICFFDGQGGGTAQTIAYAKLKELEIINTCVETPVLKNTTIFEVIKTP